MKISVWPPFCVVLAMSATNLSSCVSQDLILRNSCCSWYRILYVSVCLMMLLVMMCSSNLQEIHVSEIGRYLQSLVLWPFLVDWDYICCWPFIRNLSCIITSIEYDSVWVQWWLQAPLVHRVQSGQGLQPCLALSCSSSFCTPGSVI